MFNKKFSLLIIVLLLVFSIKVFAFKSDLFPASAENASLKYTLSPKVPQPNQYVKLKVVSYQFNINAAHVFYYIDNELIEEGIGDREFSFQAPDGGQKMNITVVVNDVNGKIYRKDFSIRPMEVTMVYESIGAYKPEFYQGKAYAISNSKVKFKAFPDFFDDNGNYIDPKNLIYYWSLNFERQGWASGYGRQTFTIDRLDAFPRDTVVQVTVMSKDGHIKAKTALILQPDNSFIDFYNVPIAEPFRFENVDKDNVVTFKELSGTLRAVPYFMNGIYYDPNDKQIDFKWKINDEFVFKNYYEGWTYLDLAVDPESDIRSATIGLDIYNDRLPLQYASERVEVKFSDKKENTNDSFRRKNTSKKVNINNKNQNEDGGFFGLF